jgi:hypothetical protein
MGITFAKLFQRLFSKKEMRILMVRPAPPRRLARRVASRRETRSMRARRGTRASANGVDYTHMDAP